MDKSKRSQRLIIVAVTMLLGITISAALQVFVLQQDTPVYYAEGALAAVSPKLQDASGGIPESLINDCFDGVIEKLESEEIQRRALSRVLAAAPWLPMCPVKVEGRRIKNSHAIRVGAQGGQPDYITTFLDALMDEFAAFSVTADDPVSGRLGAFTVQKRASAAVRVLDDWQEPAISGVITGGVSGLLAGLILAFIFVRPENVPAFPSVATEPSPEQGMEKIIRQNQHSRSAGGRPLVWGVMIGIALGLSVQIIRLTSRPIEFRSLAKVVALKETAHGPVPGSPGYAEYYGKIIRELESPELALKAMRRVKNLNPETRERDVDIRVAQTRGSAVFNVLATSDEPQYTRVFLDALLDEFTFLSLSQAQEAGRTAGNDVAVQERATPASENIEDWTMLLLAGAINGTLVGGLLGMLSKWLGRRRRMQTADIAF